MGGSDMQKAVEDAKPEEKVREMEALINSMTPFERKNPDNLTQAVSAVLPQVLDVRFKTSIVCSNNISKWQK